MKGQSEDFKHSTDYHDYVIKDGVFIGKFEEMYKNCKNPWNQLDEIHVNSLGKSAVIDLLKYLKIGSLVEFGCGLGAFTNKIHTETGIKITGVDCSETAIKYAKSHFPNSGNIDFFVDDIKNISRYHEYDCYLFADIMWLILEELDGVLLDMQKNLKGKYLINIVSFYKGGQKYGTDKFTNPEQLIKYIPFESIASITVDLAENKDAYGSVTAFRI